MRNAFLPRSVFKQATPFLGAAAMSAIALLGMPEAVKAQGDCSLAEDGPDWVSTCPEGVDKFPKSWAALYFWLVNPDGSMGDTIHLLLPGPATVTREAGADGIIKTTLEEKFTGDGFTLTGTGTGEIQDLDGDGLATSFFDVFAELEGPFGKARNMDPITVYGDRLLAGVPPNQVPGVPFTDTPPFFTPLELAECTETDPTAAIIYCGFDDVDFFAVDDDGNFVTDPDGNKIKVAVLHAEKHIVHTPEPSAMLAIAGFGTMLGLMKKRNSKKS